MKDCFGYVYKFTHKETGKWYIGSHDGSKTNYNGSGTAWRKDAMRILGLSRHKVKKIGTEI